ncbi:DPP IV N-terminal domain-containing protein [Parafilimonas sp.]|uniref:S9 family peptidase n=1 Tax=Parafilimonas sp. TaxID=1969739 RepID=UPI0039E6A3CB
MRKIFLLLPAALAFMVCFAQKDSVTISDYARAESMLAGNLTPYIYNTVSFGKWISDDQYAYQTQTLQGIEYIMIDAAKGARTKLTGKPAGFGGNPYRPESKEVLSPDGRKAAFIKDYNVWVRDVATSRLTQLTADGVPYYGYATDNAGWKHSDNAILRWSPDSKKIATFRQDERKAGDMYLATTNVGHPVLEHWKYPLPGDSNIVMIERVVIDVERPKVIRLQIPPDPHRATLSDDISSSGTFDDVSWSDDGSQFAFVSTSRDHKIEKVRIADANTGAVREVFEESVPTQYESGWGAINWKYLPATKEIIWFSERDNWGHLYLYDATTGKLKNQITKGNWVVTQLLHVDEKNRAIYFLANGQDPANPYFTHFYKIGLDGKKMVPLTPETGFHRVSISPSHKYFIDDCSQPNVPNTIVLRNTDGKLLTTLEKTDIRKLKETGWQPPLPVTLKAHDDTTDIYGLVFKPSDLDTAGKYPVVVYIYPGPQGGSIGGNWGFAAARGDNQALAELGFIVIVIEGTANPLRSKSYHDMSYGFMAENTLPDQIAGIRQLAARYAYIDTNRVGIWGHSGGGFATACAMFRFPDFFKVGISESGNHDNRNYEDDWGERYIGLLAKDASGKDNYEAQANQVYAGNLKGKLLLAHGMLDDNVPPYNTLLVVEALEKANKDYDLIIFPNSRHGYGPYAYYMMRRRWDYFVTNLLGAAHPKEYKLSSPAGGR